MVSEQKQEGDWARGYHEWTVGDRLRAARESVTSDRKKFAEMIEISPDTIRAYERGGSKPKPYILAAWCLATGFDELVAQLGQGEYPGCVVAARASSSDRSVGGDHIR